MKKTNHLIILLCVIGVAILFIYYQQEGSDSINANKNAIVSDPYKELRSMIRI